MKQSIYLLFSITLFLFACSNNQESGETAASSSNEVLSEFIQLTFEGAFKS